jgi:hypothetical protein
MREIALFMIVSLLPGGAARILSPKVISAMLLLKQVNVGGSTKTVIGRALRESVTTASPSPVSDATRVLWALAKMPLALMRLDSD